MRYHIALLLTLMTSTSNITPITSNSETMFPKNLKDCFDLYGFTSPEQKEALTQLFNFASIANGFADKPACKPISCPPASEPSLEQKTDQSPTSPSRRIGESFEQTKPEQLILDILNMVKATQEKFTIRKGTQERWEICPRSWMVQNQVKILASLTALGFVKSIQPQKKKVDAICILGGTAEFMLGGVLYTEQLLKSGLQADTIILLSGERYLTKNIDGTEQELEIVAQQLELSDWQQLTEMHLLEHLFNTHANLAKKLTVHAINTPAGALPRPTTQTTLLELFSWLEKHPKIKSVLFISHQPCTLYQKAIIDSMFTQHQVACEHEVAGAAERDTKNVQFLLEGLGGYLWAATPKILAQIVAGLESSALESLEQNTELKKLCWDLYGHNPLLYQALPSILSLPSIRPPSLKLRNGHSAIVGQVKF
jgi:hypothetical protein